MILGSVNEDREAIIRLSAHGPNDEEREIEAVIDTGFDGSLSLPSSLIADLDLQWRQRGRAVLADGSESVFDIYEGTVVWDRQILRIAVDEADTVPLVGMTLLDGYELNIRVRVGGEVTISLIDE